MTANRKRDLPRPVPAMTMHPAVQEIMWQAAMGTLDAPTRAGLPAMYLAAARALIREAQRIEQRKQQEGVSMGPRWEVTR